MSTYGAFAEIYDVLMDDFDYPAWADYYLTLLERAGVKPSTMCDCACGTGSLSYSYNVPYDVVLFFTPKEEPA